MPAVASPLALPGAIEVVPYVLDGPLLEPYLVGFLVSVALAIAVVIVLNIRFRRSRRSDGLLSSNVFDAFFGDAQVGIAVVDEHGAIARTNAVFEKMTGYEQSTLIGKLYVDLVFDPGDATGRDRVIGALDRFGESHTLTLRRHDGSFFRARFIVTPAPASLSRNQSVIFVEEVGPDRDREPIRRDDEQRDPALSPTNQSEKGAPRKAGPTSILEPKTHERFLSVLNDELLTPLTVVRGNLELLNGVADTDQQDLVGAVRAGVNQLTERLESLVYFARLQAGTVGLYRTQAEILALTESVIAQMIAEGRVDVGAVRMARPPQDISGLVDHAAFSVIVRNLIDNAVRFGEGRSVSVSVACHAGNAVLAVSNVGGGFTAEESIAVFESFKQLSSGPARTHGGFGIGLAVVRELVERLSGSVVLSSEKGEGATFMVRIPIAPDSVGLKRAA